jgi:hypothetical protein
MGEGREPVLAAAEFMVPTQQTTLDEENLRFKGGGR